ncbi:MAG TPA: hypothetical protein DEA47_02360 [Peptococcaceae bacterium]|nr:MAG: hypothetical protein XD50_0087 [Clostridia bacterium 41_269]HBT20203.1 hypothetical protein [Peptococcaceae bacterium]
MKSSSGRFKSCYQCVALLSCFPYTKLDREEAKEIAASCTKPYKGITTDVVEVKGQSRGMSRKKAFKYSQQGKAKWIGRDRIELYLD